MRGRVLDARLDREVADDAESLFKHLGIPRSWWLAEAASVLSIR